MIRLLILDQGGLITRDFDIAPEAAFRLGLEPEELRAALAPDMEAFMRGELEPGELWRRVEERTGKRAPEDYFATLFRPRIDRPTFDLAGRICRAGLRLVCGTNTIDSHYRVLREAGHFEPFAAVYASQLMRLAKPDPAFYRYILEAEGCRPEESFFADDNAENVEAARRLGIEARLFVEAEGLAAELEALGLLVKEGVPR